MSHASHTPMMLVTWLVKPATHSLHHGLDTPRWPGTLLPGVAGTART